MRVTGALSAGMLEVRESRWMPVKLLAVCVVVALLPLLVEAVGRIAMRAHRWSHRRWQGRVPWWPRRYDPSGPPIERLSRDLRRLMRELDRIERSNPPAKAARMRATTLAYDDVLLAACRALEVELPAQPPLRPVERLEAEAELARHGLLW